MDLSLFIILCVRVRARACTLTLFKHYRLCYGYGLCFSLAGDVDSLWKVEKLRSESMKQHTLVGGFSCAKGFLLERKPRNVAATIQVLHQILYDAKKPGIMVEIQKLVSGWPLEVIKRQKEEDRKEHGR